MKLDFNKLNQRKFSYKFYDTLKYIEIGQLITSVPNTIIKK